MDSSRMIMSSASVGSSSRIPVVKAFGFAELGIRKPLAEAVQKAYAEIARPTLAQTEYIQRFCPSSPHLYNISQIHSGYP